ncbi:tRNA (adenosine(37)-N6)-threonylcarbamoyltransferase complex transferase subunit TsaD [Treponema pallidum]|uniref:tRNA N6-adenosine threonylcarbamoyltransferase n=3 Tax=Treponema pallidum TaxID=160 RepID=TSAD_TREPA|nr:tRNA (adenosine(37)-N6)-threonylcarbamoyltransferase complex transferase subunit TsaD [Treponema pallidum]B2S3R9.1 RecName: Full=tRNA N6-adenosine threonylcarbamoyltransferase; AltName: Full=N6-L-threonylcarbamoyladenine synthase; Short=t(6)A synthase; AltName: Full=t(6)A37 threonylcarbamoyladenosine biosynthesis protein TsaD; AltName: Full=tRNA threonylcarbamoyladenosine biosynthesis protein TsaD [Treponema pallidum subsp. pallidum SS14]O83686.1 RecName: Full=tRNA N6-adenosine threonylcarbamo
MNVLGIETSCDETAVAIVKDGTHVCSNVVATQIPFHAPYRGIVPELASRKHIEWILPTVKEALARAQLTLADIDGIAVTHAPGLTGSLLVGLTFAKTLAWSMHLPFIAVNHLHAHFCAAHVEHDLAYPYVGLLASGGHALVCVVHDFDQVEALGATIDDAPGEAFDKVAAFYGFGYPGGKVIETLAEQGDARAARFPLPHFHGKGHRYDVSYSGLKTAVIHQLDHFWNKEYERTAQNIAAAFQACAINILLRPLARALQDTGLPTAVVCGGVAANSLLRKSVADWKHARCVFPSREYCTDNAVMVAALGYRYLIRGDRSFYGVTERSRIAHFSKRGGDRLAAQRSAASQPLF